MLFNIPFHYWYYYFIYKFVVLIRLSHTYVHHIWHTYMAHISGELIKYRTMSVYMFYI